MRAQVTKTAPFALLLSYRPRRGSHLPQKRPASVAVQSKSLLLNNMMSACRVRHFHLSIKGPQLFEPSSGEMHDLTATLRAEKMPWPNRWARASSLLFWGGISFYQVSWAQFRFQLLYPPFKRPDLLLEQIPINAAFCGESSKQLDYIPGGLVLRKPGVGC
jgi:hypothetical protein